MSGDRNEKQKLIPTSQGQCIWVDAGVISYRLCTLNYQCERCSLHQALLDGPQLVQPGVIPPTKKVEIERQREEFADLFKKLPAGARKCRYMLSGDVSYKLCIDSFKCASCSFAQMMEDSIGSDIDTSANEELVIGGLRIAGARHYHRGHVWIQVEPEGDVRVGVDDFYQKLVGEIRNIRLPKTGESLAEGLPCCELRLARGGIDVPTPVSGQVIASNKELLEHPSLVNEYPYTNGWLYTVRPSNLSYELVNLLYGQEARLWFEQEIERVNERTQEIKTGQGLAQIDRGAVWQRSNDREMTGEFLLAQIKKAA